MIVAYPVAIAVPEFSPDMVGRRVAALRSRLRVKPETGGVAELDGLHPARHPFWTGWPGRYDLRCLTGGDTIVTWNDSGLAT